MPGEIVIDPEFYDELADYQIISIKHHFDEKEHKFILSILV